MARKVSLIVIWPSFKTKWLSYHMLNGIILFKKSYISLIIATRGSKCENNLKEVMAQFLTFTFDPYLNVKWGYLTMKPYISFSSPLLLILRREITAAAVALFSFKLY